MLLNVVIMVEVEANKLSQREVWTKIIFCCFILKKRKEKKNRKKKKIQLNFGLD